MRPDRLSLYVRQFISQNIIDPKISVLDVKATADGERGARLEGKSLLAEYSAGLTSSLETLGFSPVQNNIQVLPSESLGERRWALVTTHTLVILRSAHPRSEMTNQIAFGEGVRLLEDSPDGKWVRLIGPDGYIGWCPSEGLRRVDLAEWKQYFGADERARLIWPVELQHANGERFIIPASAVLPIPPASAPAAGTGSRASSAAASASSSIRFLGPVAIEKKPETGILDDDADPGSPAARGHQPVPRPPAHFPGPGNAQNAAAPDSRAVVRVALPFPAPDNMAEIPAVFVEREVLAGYPSAATIKRMTAPYIGIPYVWGGITERGMDCSGFTQHLFRLRGFWLARDADEQSIAGRLVAWRGEGFELVRPGDLLFFVSQSGRISHVALSLGGAEFVHSSGEVQMGSLDPASPIFHERYSRGFLYVRRIGKAFE